MLTRSDGHGVMAHPPRRLATFELKCLLCGRVAGQVVARVLIAGRQAGARIWTKTPRCGACGGTLLLEPGEASV
jgi:hypothetical protein